MQLQVVTLIVEVVSELVEGVSLGAKILLESVGMREPQFLEFLRFKIICTGVFFDLFSRIFSCRDLLQHDVVSNINERDQVAKLGRNEFHQLQVAAEHEVSTEVLILLVFGSRNGQFCAKTEINQRELQTTLAAFSHTDVFWLQVTV